MNTGFISNTYIPEFEASSGYFILFLCSHPRNTLSKEFVKTEACPGYLHSRSFSCQFVNDLKADIRYAVNGSFEAR